MRSDLPFGTVTFLFTDVEGSTKLLHSLGAEAYAEALAEHRRVIREACAREGGVEVDTQGDAFFFAFPTAAGALAAAGDLTEALASGPIQVRVGLHTGTPLLTDEGYVGDDVHLAARIAAASHGGQVVVSSATAVLMEPSGSEPQALSVVDLGEHRLKDIAEAVSIYQLGEGSFPPLKTISNTNLPRPASSFVGREAELEAVLSRIGAGARLVTLSGPGGTGKTRLALEAASVLVPEYKAGVFWVGLAALRDPALVAETIAQTLGAKDGLAEHIAERELLLLLDNLEQVIEAAPALSALLVACPNLALLVTSRELLRIQGEVEYPVPPLAEPEAVALFCERAQLEPSEEIAELCARLDSLPLAVELAAARTKALSPAQILERISQRLDLLKGGRDADPRQQTLRATIEWSYELLSPDEQQLFARLSVFAGGCTLEAAEEVCDADLDTLQSLVEKSLLRFSNERYWMLETIREYAAEELGARGDDHLLSRRHAEWCTALAEELDRDLRDASTALQARRLDTENPNFRRAMEWAASSTDAVFGARIAISLTRYWWMRGRWAEGLRWLLTFEGGDLPAPLAWQVLECAAWLTGEIDAERAVQLAEEAVASVRELDDSRGLAQALMTAGNNYETVGLYRLARSALEEAREIMQAVDDRHGLAASTFNLGYLAKSEGSLDEAENLYESSLAFAREIDAAEGVASCLLALGRLAREQGRPRDCLSLVNESLSTFYEMGFMPRLADALLVIAEALVEIGEAQRAAQILGVVKGISDELGFPVERERCVALEQAVGDALDDGRVAALVSEGHAMPVDQVIAFASSID